MLVARYSPFQTERGRVLWGTKEQKEPTNKHHHSIHMFSVCLYKRAASQGPQYLWCLILQMETKKQQNKTHGKRKRAWDHCPSTCLSLPDISLTPPRGPPQTKSIDTLWPYSSSKSTALPAPPLPAMSKPGLPGPRPRTTFNCKFTFI